MLFRRAGIPFRSVSGWLRQESAWQRIGQWIRAAHVRAALRHARHGLMGHLYPGMLDVSTDLTLLPVTFGSHVEVLEFDDLRHRVEKVTDAEVAERVDLARRVFTVDDSVVDADFAWGAKVSVGRSGWTGSPTTSPSTRWPTTTAAWTGSSTSGLARG